MRKLILCPIGGLSEKRVSRMLEIELRERGIPVFFENDGEDNVIVFILGILDEETAEVVSELSLGSDAVLCYREAYAELTGALMIERPFDVPKLCDSLDRLCRRRKGLPNELDITDGTVTFRGEKIKLSAKELALLKLLFSKRGEAVSREEAFDAVFGGSGKSNTVDVYIRYLREKLDLRFDERLITTVRGKGYMLK